jgi:hypothetical protein
MNSERSLKKLFEYQHNEKREVWSKSEPRKSFCFVMSISELLEGMMKGEKRRVIIQYVL